MVSVKEGFYDDFSVKAGIRQESALGPLLFVIVMDALTEDVRNGSLTELLHADNRALR